MKLLSNILSSITSVSSAALLFITSSENRHDKSSTTAPLPITMTTTTDNTIPHNDDPTYGEYHKHWDLYPHSYTVHRIPSILSKNDDGNDSSDMKFPKPAFHIDGNIDKDIWQNVRWSDAFGDIQGEDEPEPKNKIPTTRFKALYDDSYLYVAAILYPAAGLTTEAHYTDRNSPIYQRDSDFEIFIDVDNSNHMYKELEINAINTVWNLLLDKPYDDGGVEHSGRIAKMGESRFYEVSHQQTASRVITGTLNDESNHTGALWSVEMALSYKDILANTTLHHQNYSPINTFWRVNFSRVEKQGKINWTWQPQIRWNPETRQFSGYVQMHLPDSWGYFIFSDAPVDESLSRDMASSQSTRKMYPHSTDKDSLWPEKLTAMTIYYALHYHKSQYGHFTDNISDLSFPADIVVATLCCEIRVSHSDEHGEGFVIRVHKKSDQITSVVQVHDDRLLEIIQTTSPDV
jgi:hypothetical protein